MGDKKSRNIPRKIENALWSVAAGRCEICGKKLYIEEKTNTLINISQKAHIRAFSENGPRFSEDQTDPHVLDNLMLLCMDDHKLIDDSPELYTVQWLKKQKKEFEDKEGSIIDVQRIRSSILSFKSIITKNDTISNEKAEFNKVLLKNGYFSDGKYYSVKIDLPGSEHNADYFGLASTSIQNQLTGIKDSIKNADCVSVFGLAPQPLLIYLGFLLNDESNIKVYQRFREGNLKWDWKSKEMTNSFTVREINGENESNCEVNVIVSISAEISPERVFEKQGNHDTPTYVLQSQRQTLDAIRSEVDADKFISIFREKVIEKIRTDFPKTKYINIFMAAPVSIPIRMGMNYQKNVDVEWRIYNQQQDVGFVYALSIKGDN